MVKMILNGQNSEANYCRIASSIADLLAFHAVKRHQKGATRRHDAKQETPTSVYVAMKLYGATRSRKLIDMTHELGMSHDTNWTSMTREL